MRKIEPPRLKLRSARGNRQAYWFVKDQEQQFSTGAGEGDRAKAEAWLADYIIRKQRPTFGNGDPAKVKVCDCLTVYGEKHGVNSARSGGPGFEIGKLADFWGERTVAEVTPERCDEYVKWRSAQRNVRATKSQGKPIAVSTARRELVTLSAALNWCYENPDGETPRLDRPPRPVKLPQVEHIERHLTESEVAALLWAALGWDKNGIRHPQRINRHLARFILIALYTGTRHDAVLKMQWLPNTTGGWFDLNADIMHRRGQGQRQTNKKRLPVAIPPRLLPHLRRWRKFSTQYVVEYDGKPIADSIRRSWKQARLMVGLGDEVTPHILKHTCATMMLERGKTVWEVAAALSTSPEVINKHYASRTVAHTRKTFDVFSRRGWK